MTMSKSNNISNMATLDDHHTLADSELDAVSGGFPGLNNMIANTVGQALGQATNKASQESGSPSWPR
jgi:hypothetical protein